MYILFYPASLWRYCNLFYSTCNLRKYVSSEQEPYIPCYFSSSWTIYDMYSLLFLFLLSNMWHTFSFISAPHGQYMTCILCYFSSSWACVQCKAPYDMDEIEDTLLDAIHRKSMAFILQDLKCVKCNGVRYFIIRHKMNRLAIIANDSFSCIHVYILNIQGFSSHCKFYEMGKIC